MGREPHIRMAATVERQGVSQMINEGKIEMINS